VLADSIASPTWHARRMESVAVLRNNSFFRFLTDDDLTRLAHIGVRRSYSAGDPMVEESSARGGLFVILSGAAEVNAGGAVQGLGPGDFFGEMALLPGSRRTATVLAVEPVEVMIFETMDYRAFLIENPSVAVTLLEGVAGRLRVAQASRDR
jgi:CRP-like cAMP-binding protein